MGLPLLVRLHQAPGLPDGQNAFLLGTLLFDRRLPRVRPAAYPPVSILVAAYNEAAAIRDTLTSLAAQTYPGDYEILVLNDGSTDGSSDGSLDLLCSQRALQI